MKKKYSVKWKSSSKPRKQKKFRSNAPNHVRHKLISAHLSKDLKKKYGRRSFPLKQGDEVKVTRGKFKGKMGKISTINTLKLKVYVEGLQTTKRDGTKVNVPVDPSNLIVKTLETGDKKRMEALTRKAK